MNFGAKLFLPATTLGIAACMMTILAPPVGWAQGRNRSALVIEDAGTTSPRSTSARRAGARQTPAPRATPEANRAETVTLPGKGTTEFVPGRRTNRTAAAGVAATAATVAGSTETSSIAATASATSSALEGTPSLVDRLLAVGESSGITTGTLAMGKKNAVLITLRGALPERDQVSLFSAPTRSLNSILTLLRRTREDKDVSHLVLRLAGLSVGLADAQEIRSLIVENRERGKKVIAILEDESQVSYLVAVAADQIVMPPSGGISLTGLRADSYFLKGLLAKVGVEAEFIHQGQYKSMGEMFERDSFSPAARKNMEEMVDSLYVEMTTMIGAGRKMSVDRVKTVIDMGPATTSMALERGLVDRVVYTDEFLDELRKETGKVLTGDEYNRQGRSSAADEMANPFSLLMGMGRPGAGARQDPALARLPQVAIVYANGSINQGGSEEGFENTETVLSDDMVRTLEEIRKDRRVKAVLLRVNSPGGSAFASDLIWKKLRELDKEKPVIASMGSVAASGGYYIAMGARKVYATSGTLTGSIGVVGGKFSLAGTYERLGITKESIGRGAFSDLNSDTRLFNPTERSLIDAQMREVYDDFLNKAARSRSMSRDQVHELAQGRVWTGSDALKNGLIDSTEGLVGAISEIKKQIGVKEEDKVALVPYPKEKTLFDMLSRVLSSSGGSGARLLGGVGGLGSQLSGSLSGMGAPAGLRGFSGMAPATAAEFTSLWAFAPPALRQAITTVLTIPTMMQKEKVLLLSPVAVDIR